jgi:UDP-2-acetamido-2,6-beta-L-arabino-hexul-4-ose reductase
LKVAVTGPTGLLGWHTRCAMHAAGIETVAIHRDDFADQGRLAGSLDGVDAVVHAAGANRGPEGEIAGTNVRLSENLLSAIKISEAAPLVVYLNSTHRDRPTAYGRSKRVAAEVLQEGHGAVLDLVLPGVFGEHGRPYHNSVVSTFCHQLTAGESMTINDDAELELVHAQDVADHIIDAVRARRSGQSRLTGRHLTVRDVAERLGALHDRYNEGIVPPISDSFERALFNTLRSYRFPHGYPTTLAPRLDLRGRLVEVVKSETPGQTFISSTSPGVTRGNHYHRRKVERFVVVDGEATISLRRLFTSNVVTFRVAGDAPVAIDMPTLHAHNITNVADRSLVTVFWADEIFDPERPDTVAEEV